MAFCNSCGAELAADTKFCSKCGAAAGGDSPAPGPSAAASSSAGSGSGVSAENRNLMGALSYLLIPAIIFLLVEPFNKDRFIRFHSWQSILFAVATFVINIALGILGIILSFVGIGLILFPISMLFSLAVLVLWVVLLIKAFQGQEWQLPVIGDMAAKKA